VPDDVVVDVVFEHLDGMANPKGFILDGFPRTLDQAVALDKKLAEIGSGIDSVVVIEVSDDKLIDRIAGRFTCASCGEGYHDSFKRPARDNVCDKCGGHEFKRRPDDQPETVKNRLKVYHQLTAPLIDYYRQRGKVVVIDGELSIEDVSKQMDKALSSFEGAESFASGG
jgi:adenylate kinase